MQLREKLPDQYDTIRLFAEVLPGKEASPAFPFSGFTVNINVVTRAHRDVKDETLCIVLVVGSFDGGELVLWELGLVLATKRSCSCISIYGNHSFQPPLQRQKGFTSVAHRRFRYQLSQDAEWLV